MITALQQVVVILKVQSTQFSPCCITKSYKTFCKQQKSFLYKKISGGRNIISIPVKKWWKEHKDLIKQQRKWRRFLEQCFHSLLCQHYIKKISNYTGYR